MAEPRLGIVWRGDPAAGRDARPEQSRLWPVFQALAAEGVRAEPVVFAEEWEAEARAQLLALDGALVWVDPISGGRDRSRLDALLRDVASRGVWVSAHPDVISRIGTKDVLYETRALGWGTDVQRYADAATFAREFPARLRLGPRVLKPHRGNGGIGVWKVELLDGAAAPAPASAVRVQHARDRGTDTEELPLEAFLSRCAECFAGDGHLVEQPFMPRIAEGMARCYLAGDAVAGFARQYAAAGEGQAADPARVLGIPSAKTMYGPDAPAFRALRAAMESDWLPGMLRVLGVDAASLPAIWDADFLFGPKGDGGEDTYVLCEINASSCYPLPAEAIAALARVARERVEARRRAGNRREAP